MPVSQAEVIEAIEFVAQEGLDASAGLFDEKQTFMGLLDKVIALRNYLILIQGVIREVKSDR